MNNPHPSTEPILAIVRGELSPARRWVYRLMLLVVSVLLALLVALWATEPGLLPRRLHISFAAMSSIALGWVAVLAWILTRRSCPTAIDRLATNWMATLACCVFLAISVPIALFRGQTQAALGLGVTGIGMLAVALFLLRGTYALRARLRTKLTELEAASRTTVPSLVGLVILSSFLVSPDESFAIEQSLTPITIETRDGTLIQAETGHLRVPLKHSSPNGRSIEIAFIRVRSVADEPRSPTFVLAGGPGDSGIRVVRGMFMGGGDRIRSVLPGDIIGIDQRGAGAAKPNLDVTDRYGFPISEPGSLKTYLAKMNETCRVVAKRLKEEGVDLTAFNTVENADDINELRRHLGYDKINLWGTSYGSHLALTLLRRHENHIDRVLLASPEGPDHTLKRPSHVTACLRRFAKNDRELLPLMNQVLQGLKEMPAQESVPHPVTGTPTSIRMSDFDVRLWTWAALSRVETSRKIPAAYQAMNEGNFSEPARFLLRYRAVAGVGSAMKHAMDISSGCTEKRSAEVSQESKNCLLGDVVNFPTLSLQSAWNLGQLDDGFRRPVRSTRPVLLLCGELDPRTPVENARELQAELPNSHLVIVEGEGHGFRPRKDVLRVASSFFRGESLPRVQRLDK